MIEYWVLDGKGQVVSRHRVAGIAVEAALGVEDYGKKARIVRVKNVGRSEWQDLMGRLPFVLRGLGILQKRWRKR